MSAEAARPGSTFFVPGVRIMALDELRAAREAGTELTQLTPDILRVEVTRVNSGSCQYSITLNNWFDTLPADRRSGAGEAERLKGAQPLWPRFKYNDFSILDFGKRLRIEMRYWPDPIEGLSDSDRAVQRWAPMISGPVTDMKFTFSSSEGARLTVSGEDDLRLLKNKNKKKVDYRGKNEEEIVTDVLRRSAFPLTLAEARIARPAFFSGGGANLAEAHEEGQSHLEYLQKFADRFDFELFLEYQNLSDPASPIEFHLEPPRSRKPPDNTLRDIFILERGKQLVEFTPTFKVLDQYTKVMVRGRHRVRSRPELVAQPATPEILEDELHRDASRRDPQLVPGPLVRQRLYGENPNTLNNATNIDEERGRAMAQAVLRKQAREFMTISGETIGLPRLRPGFHAEVRGMRPPFDGFYYLTQSVHSFGAEGFRTKFTARRPGMPQPPYGEV